MEDRKELQIVEESGNEQFSCQSSLSTCKDINEEKHVGDEPVHVKPEGDSAPHSVESSIPFAADYDFEAGTSSSSVSDGKVPGALDADSCNTAIIQLSKSDPTETGSPVSDTSPLAISGSHTLNTSPPSEDSQSAPSEKTLIRVPPSEILSTSGINGDHLTGHFPSSKAADSVESLKETTCATSEGHASTFVSQNAGASLTKGNNLTVSIPIGSSEEGSDSAMLQCAIHSAEPNDSMVDAIDGVMPVESMTTNLTSRSELSCTSSAKKSSEITKDAADRPCSPSAASKNRDEFLFTPSLDNSDVMDVSHANLASSARISTKGSALIPTVEGDGKTSLDPLQNKPVPSEPENLLTDKEPSFIEAHGSSFRATSPKITFSDSRNEIDGPISEKDTTQHMTNGCQGECASPCCEDFSESSNYASQMPCEKSSREQDLQSLAAALTNGHSDLDEPPNTDQYAAASPLPAKTATDLSEQLEVTEQSEKSVPIIECLSAAPEQVIASSQAIDISHPPTDKLPSSKETAADVPLPFNDASTNNCIENLVDSPLSSQAPPDQAAESSVFMSTSSSLLVSPVDSGKTENVVEHVEKPSQDASTTDTDAKISLEQQVEYLSGQLSRTQTQLQSLLEEKHRWLVANRPTQAASQGSSSLASEKAALVVKYAQSERLRCKAEARIKELESLLNKNRGYSLTESSSPSPASALQNDTKELQKQLDEMTKMLANSRERAETFRHSLRQEESRVSDLNAKLTATREAHRSEQKRAASQVETISRLNRELESARRQLKEADRLREREAERLCNEVAAREATEKLHRVEKENAALEARLAEMGESEKQKEDLKAQLITLQASYDDLLHLKSDLEYCQRRETQLSEFTRRLTERNAALQSDYLSTQSRLQASESAVSEARRAADEAAELVAKAEAKLVDERTCFQQTIASLETKVAQLTESLATLNSALAREREERNALRRKQHAQDRELARLLAVQSQRRSSSATTAITGAAAPSPGPQDPVRLDSIADQESAGNPQNAESGSQCSAPSDSDAPNQCDARPLLGNALLASCDPSAKTSSTAPTPQSLTENSKAKEELSCPSIQMVEPSKSLLVSKIEKLQRMNLRLSEKNEFMRDHINQLTSEIQRKTQLLQHFLVSDPEAGGASPMNVDENKANIIQKGGLMASVFSGQAMDSQANLKVCLQINQKLQNVLEDTLFKNMTLKENVDTLADELARLTRANRELKELVSQSLPVPPLTTTSTD